MDDMRMDMKEFSDKFCEQDHRTKDTETIWNEFKDALVKSAVFLVFFAFFHFRFLSLQSLRTDGVIHGRFQRDMIFFLGICLFELILQAHLSDHEIVIANINIGSQRQRRPKRTVYQYKKGNMGS
jgi:hypothetical protein